MDSVLTILVNHKTVIGAECIGGIELKLRECRCKTMPIWFKLRKKGKFDEVSEKYRGELLLKFYFCNKQLSSSALSINSNSS